MPEVYMGMGHTAEAVATALRHLARSAGWLRNAEPSEGGGRHRSRPLRTDEIVPVSTSVKGVDERGKAFVREFVFAMDEGVRPDTSVETLAS